MYPSYKADNLRNQGQKYEFACSVLDENPLTQKSHVFRRKGNGCSGQIFLQMHQRSSAGYRQYPGRLMQQPHLAYWELLLEREVSQALVAGPRPELIKNARTDGAVIAFLIGEMAHLTTESTKPFTFTVPMGLNEGKNNLAWLIKTRNEGIVFTDSTTTDLQYYFLRPGRGNIHQVFITIFGHTDRHLRQIRRVKLDPNYPKH